MANTKIRLYVDHPLGEGQSVPLDRGKAHYLFAVMRQSVGDRILVFNGRDGEFLASITQSGKRTGTLQVESKIRDLQLPPDLWLLFAPIKKSRTDFIVEKAAEMGAARIVPVLTNFTNTERVNRDRLQAHAVEAAEQCGGTYVPDVGKLEPLRKILDGWPVERQLMFCDEALVGSPVDLAQRETGPWAILIGPEGGFSPAERELLRNLPQAVPVSLGPRILRADTAAVAAMTMWQLELGDWA